MMRTKPTPSTWSLIVDPAVRKRAFLMASVVGCILAVINHGDRIVTGTMTTSDWLKVGLTFLVPYSVSTFSSILAIRDRDADMRRTQPPIKQT